MFASQLQRLTAPGASPGFGQAMKAPPIVREVSESSGQPSGADARTFAEPRFGYTLNQVPVQLQRTPAVVQRQVQQASPPASAPPAGVSHAPSACDQATTGHSDAQEIIEQARAAAIQYVNQAIPIVMHGIHEAPSTWNGMIAQELLDRHFHCPGQEDMEDILTTLQEIRARLPTVSLDCLGSDRECNPRLHSHFTHRPDLSAGLLCPGFFHDPQSVRAGELIALVARLLPRPFSCTRHDSCYNDFVGVGHSLMIYNAYSYGYFSTAAAGHELVPEPPGGVTCRPPESSQSPPSYPRSPSSTRPELCSSQGTVTGRQIVVSEPAKQAHVLTSSSAIDGDIYEERIDHSGRRFVCDHGRRIDQSW
ncbi:MAG TPA: hypothetical protein VMI53_01030 [Opitutaceae bacterium]|nr:hypothetical protein [Opitutaceae bacterium]